MIPEKVRADSLVPGTSVASLLPPAITDCEKCVPLVTSDGQTWGFVHDRHVALLRCSKYFSYTKHEKVKVLMIKGTDPAAQLKRFADEVSRPAGVGLTDFTTIFSLSGRRMEISRSLIELLGVKTSRIIVMGFVGRERNCQLWMGKRAGTAVAHPTKSQSLISFAHNDLLLSREALSEHAYRSIDLQPDLFGKLRSAGMQCTMIRSTAGVRRVSVHAYEMDLTDTNHFVPRAKLPVESYELVPVKTILDWCHAGLVCPEEIPTIIGFCIRHGIITPETDEHFGLVSQMLSNDIFIPFPYRR